MPDFLVTALILLLVSGACVALAIRDVIKSMRGEANPDIGFAVPPSPAVPRPTPRKR